MKNILLVSLVLSGLNITAQNYCGTVFTNEMNERTKKIAQNARTNQNKSNTLYVIPIKFHIVGESDGSGYYKLSDLISLVCDLNEDYEPVGFRFYIYGDINYINNSLYYNHDWSDGAEMMYTYNVQKVTNVYVVNDPAGNCGYFSGGTDAIAIKKSCSAPNSTTLTHELGHYFSLPHTFSGWEGYDPLSTTYPSDAEYVNGSNCSYTGDYFCDTPADFISDRWECPYSMNKVDPNGDLYHPDSSLYMSYANDKCTKRFSNEQISAMRSDLADYRGELLTNTTPSSHALKVPELFYPENEQKDIPSNYVLLQWEPIPGATSYNLQVSRYSAGNNYEINTFTNNNYYLATTLSEGLRYRWKVRPYHHNNTCIDFSTERFFYTGTPVSLIPLFNISNVSCENASDGSLSIASVSGGVTPYTYSWSTGSNNTDVNNLKAATYSVIIADSTGIADTFNLAITEPAIVLSFDSVGAWNSTTDNGTASVDAVGGKEPYSYIWSNGRTQADIGELVPGVYTVTVKDAIGCSKTGSITIKNITGIKNDMIKTQLSIQIYPNPLYESNQLKVKMNYTGFSDLTVGIYSCSGIVIKQTRTPVNADSIISIDTEQLSKGIYLLKVQSNEILSWHKLVVL